VAYTRGDDAEARRLSDEYLSDDPEELNAHAMAGNVAAVAGDYARARRHFVTGVRANPGRHDFARAARSADLLASRWLLPVRALSRFGVARAWFVGVGGGVLLRAGGYSMAAMWWSAGYIGLCVYSWIAVLLVRWLKARRFR
jgi:hypothetical protein